MNPGTWAQIVAAYEEAMGFIEAAFAGKSKAPPDLEGLHARLYRRLDELRAALTPELGPEGAVLGLAPLAILLDEQVARRLADSAGGGGDCNGFPDGPKLQSDLDIVDGGDELYRRAGALPRQQPPAHPLILGIYLFCLRAGFQGRFFDNPAAIKRYEDDLAAALGPVPYPPSPPPSPAFRRARRPIQYVVAAALGVLAVQIVLLAITRVM